MLSQWDMDGCVPAHRAVPDVPPEEERRATMESHSSRSLRDDEDDEKRDYCMV